MHQSSLFCNDWTPKITLVVPILRHSVRDHVEFAYVNIFVSQVLFVQHILDCALSVFAQILILTSCICSEIKSSICICLPCDIWFGRNSTLGVISAYNSYLQGESPLMPGYNRWLVRSFFFTAFQPQCDSAFCLVSLLDRALLVVLMVLSYTFFSMPSARSFTLAEWTWRFRGLWQCRIDTLPRQILFA